MLATANTVQIRVGTYAQPARRLDRNTYIGYDFTLRKAVRFHEGRRDLLKSAFRPGQNKRA